MNAVVYSAILTNILYIAPKSGSMLMHIIIPTMNYDINTGYEYATLDRILTHVSLAYARLIFDRLNSIQVWVNTNNHCNN